MTERTKSGETRPIPPDPATWLVAMRATWLVAMIAKRMVEHPDGTAHVRSPPAWPAASRTSSPRQLNRHDRRPPRSSRSSGCRSPG
jgi:hypothetical protein